MRWLVLAWGLFACGTVAENDAGSGGGDAPGVDGGGGGDGGQAADASPCGDCGEPTCVVMGECLFDGDPSCDEHGMQVARCTPHVCEGTTCVDGPMFDQMLACDRVTEGTMCAPDACTDIGSCAFEGDPTCDQSGLKPQSCVAQVCTGEVCADGLTTTRMAACSRTTEGNSCGADTCTDTTSCSFEGGFCDESGTKNQSCLSHLCRSGSCANGSSTPRTVTCSRVTDGDLCGASSAGCLMGLFKDLCCSSTGACTVVCGPCS